ncbi:MAG: hypothetical protein J6S94_05615 [Bacteroidaceae bacterium]|nr:hypothetical protein [Bacteroidaceae bacterium]
MKKVLFTLVFGFAFISCGTMYDTYDGAGYTNYTYGYSEDYIIYNNGYRYGYEAGVIDAITNRMVLAMALDQARAARLLELNRRYFYIFHSMPNFSFGYYNFNPGPPPPPHNPVGPGYYGGSNRPPYGGNYGNYTGRGQGGYRSNYDVNMTERDLQDAAKEYTRSVKSIVGNQNYSVFENRVRADAKQANQKVNAVRVNPSLNADKVNNNSTVPATRTRTSNSSNVRPNTNTGTTTPAASGTRVRSNSSTNTTTPAASGTRVRSNSSTNTTTPATSGTRVRSNSSTNTTTPATSGTRVRSNSSTTNSTMQQSTGNNTRTRTRTR